MEDILKEKLNNLGVSEWMFSITDVEDHQIYHSNTELESYRKNNYKNIRILILHNHNNKQGETEINISNLDNIDELLQSALELTKLQNNPIYSLPNKIEANHQVKTTDERAIKDPKGYIFDFYNRFKKETESYKSAHMGSFEAHIKIFNTKTFNSKEANGEKTSQKNIVEIVFLDKDFERWVLTNNVRLDDINGLDIKGFVKTNIKYFEDSKNTKIADVEGVFPVCIDFSEITDILVPLAYYSSGSAIYEGISNFKEGKDLGMKLDKMSLSIDPTIDYLDGSYQYSSEGLEPKEVYVIRDGICNEILASKKYADYLSIKANGDFSNFSIKPGSNSKEQLLNNCLYVIKFSSIDVDDATGDFFGEIRLGYYIKDGEWIPIKGNGVKGNIFKAIKKAKLSKEIASFSNYQGPEIMRFEELDVSGK